PGLPTSRRNHSTLASSLSSRLHGHCFPRQNEFLPRRNRSLTATTFLPRGISPPRNHRPLQRRPANSVSAVAESGRAVHLRRVRGATASWLQCAREGEREKGDCIKDCVHRHGDEQ